MLPLLFLLVLPLFTFASERPADLLLLVGLPGDKEYQEDFQTTASLWKEAAAKAGRVVHEITPASGTNQLSLFTNALTRIPTHADAELWLVLIGHGTFDGKEARYNLAGPDLGTEALATLLNPFSRPIVLINNTSASAPFLTRLSATNRIIVTATRSGWEENYARFGKFFAQTLVDPSADFDKDGQVSLLEAFLAASHRTAEFYKNQKRLATEHPLLDDNGDGKGTPPSFYSGLRPSKKTQEGSSIDGFRAHQITFVHSPEEARLSPELRAQRDALEHQLENLRQRKSQMSEQTYLQELEKILLQISHIYAATSSN